MSGELTVVRGTQKTLESAGASTASGSVSAAATATYGTDADGAAFPDVELAVMVNFATGITVGSVAVYAQPLDIDGTNDAPAPEATRPTRFIGSFQPKYSTTGAQYHEIIARNVPKLANYYLYNAATGQPFTWTLKATPRSYKPAV